MSQRNRNNRDDKKKDFQDLVNKKDSGRNQKEEKKKEEKKYVQLGGQKVQQTFGNVVNRKEFNVLKEQTGLKSKELLAQLQEQNINPKAQLEARVTYGKTLSKKELKSLQESTTGLNPWEIIEKYKDYGIKPGEKARQYANKTADTNKPGENNDNDYEAGGKQDAYLDKLDDKFNTVFENLGTLNESITQIGADADRDVAQAYADAQVKAGELGLEGTKYAADVERDWRQYVTDAEIKGKLDLQPIINAGLERVAEIEGQAARDVAETTGRYGLQSMQTRSEADKQLGKMQLAGSMYGLLGAAFG